MRIRAASLSLYNKKKICGNETSEDADSQNSRLSGRSVGGVAGLRSLSATSEDVSFSRIRVNREHDRRCDSVRWRALERLVPLLEPRHAISLGSYRDRRPVS